MTQTYLVTEALSVRTEYDARTIPGRPDDSVLCGGVHYLRASKYQVREDKGFYIPDFLSDKKYDDNPEAYSAAMDHAKHLLKAEGLLDEALNLEGLMLTSFAEEGDSRAMQAKAALKVIEKKQSKARNRLDKHDTRHTKLFLAYFARNDRSDGGEQD